MALGMATIPAIPSLMSSSNIWSSHQNISFLEVIFKQKVLHFGCISGSWTYPEVHDQPKPKRCSSCADHTSLWTQLSRAMNGNNKNTYGECFQGLSLRTNQTSKWITFLSTWISLSLSLDACVKKSCSPINIQLFYNEQTICCSPFANYYQPQWTSSCIKSRFSKAKSKLPWSSRGHWNGDRWYLWVSHVMVHNASIAVDSDW